MKHTKICINCSEHNGIDWRAYDRIDGVCEFCRNHSTFCILIDDIHFNIDKLTPKPTQEEIVQGLITKVDSMIERVKSLEKCVYK